jgi:hypothetical protein
MIKYQLFIAINFYERGALTYTIIRDSYKIPIYWPADRKVYRVYV